MNVRFKVGYRGNAEKTRSLLQTEFGGVDNLVVSSSPLATTLAVIPQDVVVAADCGFYRLIAVDDRASGLDAYVEEKPAGDLLPRSEVAWERLRRALKEVKPKLRQTTLAGDKSSTEILVGKSGFWQNLRQFEATVAVGVLVVTAAYVLVARATFAPSSWPAFLGAGIPPLVSLLLIGISAWRRGRKGTIFWESRYGR